MQNEKARDALRLLERTAIDHLSWLMRIHAAMMFPAEEGTGTPPPPSPCASLCSEAEELQALERARVAMHCQAQELLAATAAAAGHRPPSPAYRAFMAAVDAYGREARRAEAHFRRLLLETDPLTGVANRLGMMRELRREWTRALRTGRPVCIALADLDFFKQVNDTHGHMAGDRVLCATAAFFRSRLRPYDLVFRYGGEEFLFCLPDTPLPSAMGVLDRLCGLLAQQPIPLDDGSSLTVTCSIGVTEMDASRSMHEAIDGADRALYAAKRSGRNRVAAAPAALPAPPLPPSLSPGHRVGREGVRPYATP